MPRTQLSGGAVSLRHTLKKAQFLAGDVLARSCAFDWRACQPGDVYFALTTADADGHELADRAIQRGAAAVVAERLLPVSVPQVLVPDSRVALGRVCQALAGNPSREMTTVGIAGSAGKTATAMLLASIFEAAGQTAGVLSSFGHSDSLAQSAPPTATPTTAEFADWLRRMHLADCSAAVLELSTQALAERRTSGIALDIALVTNIKNEGLAEHNTAAAYQKIVGRVFKKLKPGGVAVINADDHRSRHLASRAEHQLTYAIHTDADVTGQVIERCLSEQTFMLSVGSYSSPVRTRIIGLPHLANCLAAATAAIALGLDLATIVRGLEAVERLPGRMERIECGQPFGVFVDAASSPENLSQTIKSLRQVTRGRVLVVYGSDLRSDAARRALVGRVLECGSQMALLTSGEFASEGGSSCDSLRLAHDYLDGFERPHRAHVIPNRREAIRFALSQAKPGDCVLVAGCDDLGNCPADEDSTPITDRQVATSWLYSEPLTPPRLRLVG